MKKSFRRKVKIIIIIFIIIIGIIISFFINKGIEKRKEIERKENAVIELTNKINFHNVKAKAISIYNINTGEYLYGKNEDTPLPLASLVKTMTIFVAIKNLSTETIIQLSKEAIAQNGDTTLLRDEKWNLGDLTKFTLVSSSNDGAYAISESIPDMIFKMNEEAKLIGMKSASFLNSTGLDINETESGSYSSAKDANIMAVAAYQAFPDIFNVTSLPEIEIQSNSGITHKAPNTDTILTKVPNILFSKTGYTTLAGGNLTVIFKNKENHLIAVTMLGSTIEGRFSDMIKLISIL